MEAKYRELKPLADANKSRGALGLKLSVRRLGECIERLKGEREPGSDDE